MGKTKKSNNYIIDTKTICCLIVIFTLTISLIVVSNTNKKTNNSEVIEQGGTIIDDDDDDIEYSLNTDLLPLIRLSKYDEATGEREGIVVTNNGTIFSYEFNELNVIYPASDVFAVNQTLYIDHFVDELGIVEDEDLTDREAQEGLYKLQYIWQNGKAAESVPEELPVADLCTYDRPAA